MKHAASRELYAYWEERRGRRAAPERAEIEPGAIRGALSDAFILSLDAARGHPLRLAGTRVCALFDRELRGEPFLRLWAADSRTIIAGLLAILGDERIGTVAGAERDALDLLVLDGRRQHRNGAQQTGDEPLDDARLASVAGDDHDGRDLAGAEVRPPVFEAGEEHGDGRERERLAAPSADGQPGLVRWHRRRRAAASVLAVECELLLRHRQGEQCREKDAPGVPGRPAEMTAEHVHVVERVDDVHDSRSRA
jgi:hypothetical protein